MAKVEPALYQKDFKGARINPNPNDGKYQECNNQKREIL